MSFEGTEQPCEVAECADLRRLYKATPHLEPTVTQHAATRTCVQCGRLLSQYNRGMACAACAREPADGGSTEQIAGDWVSHAGIATALRDDSAGAALRAYRLAAGLSQAVLAGMLGMTQQNLSQIEGGRAPSLEQRQRMVEVLGLAPEDLGLASQPAPEFDVGDSREVAESRARWRAERRWLNQHRNELARIASDLYPNEWRLTNTPLIACADWTIDEPIELRTIAIELDESPHGVAVDGGEPETLRVRPLRADGVHFDRYTAAIKHLDPPRLFESRPSYRLLDVDLPGRRLTFGMAAYFDKLDVSEAVGHETAVACMRDKSGRPGTAQLRDVLSFRQLIGDQSTSVNDPFEPNRRAIIPAITTLTIRLRRHPLSPTFLLHWRDPSRVATAGGTYDVVPAGEFQPSSVALWDRRIDFDLWRNIVREYAEELLGAPEHDGTRTAPIDYDNWPLYRDLDAAIDSGTLTAHLLGLGLDALTLAATILTVVVIDDDAFERAFGDVVHYNDEGEIVVVGHGRPAEGIPFTRDAVERLLMSEPMASPGAACLALAWRHRSQLLGL